MPQQLETKKPKDWKIRGVELFCIMLIGVAVVCIGFAFYTYFSIDRYPTVESLCAKMKIDKAECLRNVGGIVQIARLEMERHFEWRPAFWGAIATIIATSVGAVMLYINGYFDTKAEVLKIERERITQEIDKAEAELSAVRSERDAVASELARRKLRHAHEQLQAFFGRAEHDVELIWRLCSRRDGIIEQSLRRCGHEAKEEEQLGLISKLNSIFVPFIKDHELTSSMMIVDGQGLEYVLLHERDFLESQEEMFKPYEWRNRIMRKEAWGQKVLERYWTDARAMEPKGEKWIRNLSERLGYLKTSESQEIEYDPRARMYAGPWLFPGDEADHLWRRVKNDGTGMYWTPPYFFYTTKAAGITVSKGWMAGESRERRYVLAVDITVTEISQATTKLQVGKRGKVFVFTEDGRVLGLPSHPRFDAEDPYAIREFFESVMKKNCGPISDQEALLPRLNEVGYELGISAIGVAYEKWDEQRKARPEEMGRSLSFKFREESWDGRFEPYQYPQSNRVIWVGVIAPSHELRREGLKIVGVRS